MVGANALYVEIEHEVGDNESINEYIERPVLPDPLFMLPSKRYGKVKFFARTYGFISPDDGGEDIFVHVSQLLSPGTETLEQEQRVVFTIGPGMKGPEATNVQVISS